ncbi:hypothetical protein LCGC14_1597980 [marine sediment metagenome]|uniref:Uncharacterized protein n=1 Tax=marine sediment metagenome TaxID=412755 RepID=A0A0F9ICF3_9ZZZZ
MKKKVRELKVKIDGIAQLTQNLEEPVKYAVEEIVSKTVSRVQTLNYRHSNEVKDAVKSLYLAKAWLGEVLGELGTESPYANDGTRKTVEDIEPTADTGKMYYPMSPEYMSHIEKVDWLRKKIGKIVNEADILMTQKGRVYIFGCNVNQHLSEARFQLGFELGRIKENG